jgi:ParB family chromosome partitioning protein
LQEALGLNVKLDDRGGRGELRLTYASLEQLDELCRKLMK